MVRESRASLARHAGSLFAAALCVCSLPPTWANALTPSGTAVAVVQATSASGPGGSRTLAPAKPVFSGDRINTGGSGEAQIVFADDTRLVVGPNSSIVIDKYVYDPGGSRSQVSMQLARGAFRFISGRGSKRSFQIATPTATLGVRGTAFDVGVGGRVGTGVAVFDGSVRICSRRTGECTIVNRGCNIAVITPDGRVGTPSNQADKAALIRAAFPLIGRQDRYRGDFRVDTRGCGRSSLSPDQDVRRINLSPAGGGVNNPPGGGGPGGGGNNAPGASGNTKGGSKSASSSANSRARSNPGKSGESNAGGKNR